MRKFSEVTLGFRHRFVKAIAPKLWKDWSTDWNVGIGKDNVELERPMISFLKDCFGNKPLVGCEIGTREGINALRILRTLNIEKLYLVDPYTPYESSYYFTNSISYQNKTMENAKKLLKEYNSRIVWLREKSNDAVKFIKVPLDFCYIDGDHSYTQVTQDIENYNRLVKKGGVLGGHDFVSEFFGLCQAVLEHCNWKELQSSTSGCDWWLVKNEGLGRASELGFREVR